MGTCEGQCSYVCVLVRICVHAAQNALSFIGKQKMETFFSPEGRYCSFYYAPMERRQSSNEVTAGCQPRYELEIMWRLQRPAAP